MVEGGDSETVTQHPAHPYTRLLIALRARPGPDRRRRRARPAEDPGSGEPPSLIAPPAGCRFHPRCPHAMAAVPHRTAAALRPATAGHWAACWLYDWADRAGCYEPKEAAEVRYLAAADRLLPVHRVGRDHHQLLHPAADPGRPGHVADHRVPGPDRHRARSSRCTSCSAWTRTRASGASTSTTGASCSTATSGCRSPSSRRRSPRCSAQACRGRSPWSASPRSLSFLIGTGARRRRRLAARLLGGRAAAGHHVPVVDPVLLARPDRDRAARRCRAASSRRRGGYDARPGPGLGQPASSAARSSTACCRR